MAVYSVFEIVPPTGSSVKFAVDPDQLSVVNQAVATARRSIGGSVHLLGATNGARILSRKSVTVGGILLDSTNAGRLDGLRDCKVSVTFTGSLAGLTGNYVVLEISEAPMKPRSPMPNDSPPALSGTVQYQYSIRLEQVM